MTDGTTHRIYNLEAADLSIAFAPHDGTVSVSGDLVVDALHLDATVTPVRELGLVVTATILESTRNGTRITLCLTVPQVTRSSLAHGARVTGSAVIASSFWDVIGDTPPVLHSYQVRQLEGVVAV